MKQTILVLCSVILILGLVSGCVKKQVPTTPAIKTDAEQKIVIDSFTKLINTNPSEKDVITFIKKEIVTLSKVNVTILVLGLEDYQKKKIEENDKFFNETDKKDYKPIISDELSNKIRVQLGKDEQFTMDKISNFKDEALKTALTDIRDRGYKIITPEGMFNAIIDYNTYKQFNNFVTPDIKDYIYIRAAESDKRTIEDAALIITADELFIRAIACENFIEKYPTSKRIAEVKQMCKNYVTYYINGANNTPAFDYNTKVMNENFRTSYAKVMANSTNSIIVRAMQQHINVITNNGNKDTDAVKQSKKDTLDKIITDLKLPTQ